MINPWVVGGLTGLSAVKHFVNDKPEAARQRKALRDRQKLEAERERFSPWTGEHGKPVNMYVKDPSLLDALMQGASSGVALGDVGEFDFDGSTTQDFYVDNEKITDPESYDKDAVDVVPQGEVLTGPPRGQQQKFSAPVNVPSSGGAGKTQYQSSGPTYSKGAVGGGEVPFNPYGPGYRGGRRYGQP